MKKIRLGIIGTGRIAQRFVTDAWQKTNVQISTVYNPRLESAEYFAQKHLIRSYTTDFEQFLKEVDAVYIATPHETHADYAKKALCAGKHVLCEKPMTLRVSETQELFELAYQKHCILMEAVKTAYCPGFLALLETIKSGVIGEVRDVEACFTRLTPTFLREMTDLESGGSMSELGSYCLLPVIKIMGTDYQQITFDSIHNSNGIDLFTKAMFSYDNGFGLSKMGMGVKSEGELIISGTKGYIVTQAPWWMTKKFEVRHEDPKQIETFTFSFEGSGLQYELLAFENAIRAVLDNKQECMIREVYNDLGLQPKESIAFSRIMESFLEQERERRIPTYCNIINATEPVIWAHRGCSYQYPENTLEAFEAAAKLDSLEGIELDVQFTKDHQLVVFHDENVSRVTDGKKEVRDYTLDQLKQLKIDAGDGKYATIPTLQEVLTLMRPYCIKKGLKINIELKTSVIRYEGIEEETIALVHQYGLDSYVVYSSFLEDSIRRIKELKPDAKTGMLGMNMSECMNMGKRVNADAFHPWIGGMDVTLAKTINQFPVRAWNGVEPFFHDGKPFKKVDLEIYKMYGVTDIFTNIPEAFLKA